MSKWVKLDKGLRTLVEKAAEVDPSLEVDLVVASSDEEETEQLADRIISQGGKVKKLKTDRLQCKIPIAEVLDLADQEAVASIRLTRQHRMH